jgi:hypothetical protein
VAQKPEGISAEEWELIRRQYVINQLNEARAMLKFFNSF